MKYMYEIRPVKPIVTLEGRSLRRPSSMLLELEEVYHYSKLAAVWRKYPDTTTLVKVGGLNTAAAHCETYAEYLENMKKISQGETITVQDEPKVDEVAPEVPIEEQTEEEIIPTPEEISEDVTIVTGEQVTEVEESAEEVTPEVVEEVAGESVEEESIESIVEEVAPEVVEEVAEESIEPTVEEVKELTDEEKELAEIQALIDAEDKKEEAPVEVQGEVEEIASEKEEVPQVIEKPIADAKPSKKEHGFTQSKNIITPNKK